MTVPDRTCPSPSGSNTSNSTPGGSSPGRTTFARNARLRFGFLHSQNERISGISAPHVGASQRTVRAHSQAIGVAPSRSLG